MSQSLAERLAAVCAHLPEVMVEQVDGEQHLIFRVRKRAFAYYLFNHHDDGEVAMCFKVDEGMNEALVQADPLRFFLPSYLRHRGWVSMRMDDPAPDWEELADLTLMSYRLVAPKSLNRLLDQRPSSPE